MTGLLLLLVTVAACGGVRGDGVDVVRSDSAGVAIVVSSGDDVVLPWRFEQRLRLGDIEGPAAFASLSSSGVAVDRDGRIVILDAGNHRLLVFDSTGRHLARFGRKGGGPGELEFPSSLSLDSDGNAVVFDFSRRELVRFALDGTLLPSVQRPADQPLDRFAFTAWGMVFSRREGGRDEPSHESIYLVRDSVPELVSRLPRVTHRMVMYESCPIGLGLGPLFDVGLRWDSSGERIVAVPGGAYVVNVFEGARHVGSFRRIVAPVPTTPEMATRELGDGMRIRWSTGECTLDVNEVIEKRGMAPVLPAIGRVAIAPDGLIWVARGAVRGDTAGVDILSATGEYRGTLPAGSLFPAAFFPNGDALMIERDELDVPYLGVYRIRSPDRPGDG